ncbi:hypothetical protein D3C75_881490 [compost metagenome]
MVFASDRVDMHKRGIFDAADQRLPGCPSILSRKNHPVGARYEAVLGIKKVQRQEWFIRPIRYQAFGIGNAHISRIGIDCLSFVSLSRLQLNLCSLYTGKLEAPALATVSSGQHGASVSDCPAMFVIDELNRNQTN